MKRTALLAVIISLSLLSVASWASPASKVTPGMVVKVKDGDTVVIAPANGEQYFICRLYGIDAPETPKRDAPGQPYSEEATRELKNLILGQSVEVTTTGTKTYNRKICVIRKESLNVNLEMVKRGYAWAYRAYLKRPHASEYIDAEDDARRHRRGLWQQPNPMPPWEYRSEQRRK